MKFDEMNFIDFIKLQRGHDLTKEHFVEGIYPVVSSTTIMGYHNEYKAEGPGVIIGRSGTLGVVQYIDKNYWPHNTTLYVRDFKGNNPKFVYYFLKNFGTGSRGGGAAVPTLNRNSLSAIKVRIPNINTQRCIADILSAYDVLIENNQKQIKLLEEFAMMLYKEWFVKFRFPGYETTKIIDGVPEGWERYQFSEKVKIMSGGTPKTSVASYYGGSIPFYTPKDSDGSYFAFDTITHITEQGLNHCNSKLYPKRTIIITARGTVGKTVLLAVPMAINQSCYALCCDELDAPYYLFFSLNEEVRKLKTMANGGIFDTIIVKTFDNIHIMFPKIDMVKHFEKKVTPIMDGIENKMKQIELLRQARDKLLPKLMSGEIEV